MKPQQFEYLVIGGGPGGTPTAMALLSGHKYSQQQSQPEII